MIKDYVKIFLFLSSYAPLFLILAIKNYTETYLVIGMGVLILISVIFSLYVIGKSSKMNGDYHEVKEVEDKSNQFLEYIIAYIIPFLGFNTTSIPDLISLGIIFVLIGLLYIRSDLVYMNPLLNLMNYNLYKINDGKNGLMIITKEEVTVGKKVRIYFISKKVGVAK
jgi:hypothetical protein